jgi:hypothetical protein
MKQAAWLYLLFFLLFSILRLSAQKTNAEIFIPIDNRNEIWLKPRLDTLDNLKEYEFKIRVVPEYTISQFLFEKGLAIHTDSVLKIIPNSTNYDSYDTATLRVIVTSISGSRIILFQKRFVVKVPPKVYPMLSKPENNIMQLNGKTFLERNRPYSRDLFTQGVSTVAMYDNNVSMKPYQVKGITIAFYEKEGKQYVSTSDTINEDAVKELKKIKNPVPVFIKVDALSGKTKKVVWNKIVIYTD